LLHESGYLPTRGSVNGVGLRLRLVHHLQPGPMATTSSFDISTGADLQEVDNAVNQTVKEITQRYDFKGLKVSVELNEKEKTITLAAPDEYKLKAVWDVLQSKMVRRQVPLKNLDPGKVESAAASSSRQVIAIQDGLTSDQAREVVRVIKDAKLKKVQSAIQGDTVRISSADKDALQGVIALLKQQDFGVELKFGNYRSN
jgi:cyclic-di-GMP-binding protein